MEVSSVDRYEPAFKEAVNAHNTTIWVTLNPLANSNQQVLPTWRSNIAYRRYVQGRITPTTVA